MHRRPCFKTSKKQKATNQAFSLDYSILKERELDQCTTFSAIVHVFVIMKVLAFCFLNGA